MSEEQLAALLAKLKDDEGLQEKLKGAADLDAAVALAKEAGFDVTRGWGSSAGRQSAVCVGFASSGVGDQALNWLLLRCQEPSSAAPQKRWRLS